jgi:hypothetical protein
MAVGSCGSCLHSSRWGSAAEKPSAGHWLSIHPRLNAGFEQVHLAIFLWWQLLQKHGQNHGLDRATNSLKIALVSALLHIFSKEILLSGNSEGLGCALVHDCAI